MSDISIPGFSNQNSTINTEQIIEDLLELERVPITRIETQINQHQRQKEVWLYIGRGISQLSDNASLLFNFQNPFNDRVGLSDDEGAVVVTAERGAESSRHAISIVQNAGRDRLLSQDIARDYRVPPGRYAFSVGEEEIAVEFEGGSLRRFADEISRANPAALTAQVIRTSEDADALLFEVQVYGKRNRLIFRDDALPFAQQHGVIAYRKTETFQSDAQYVVPPQTEKRIELPQPIVATEASTLKFRALLEDVPERQQAAGFAVPPSGSVTLRDVTVPNAPSAVPLEEIEAEPVVVDNSHSTFIYLQLADGTERAVADVVANGGGGNGNGDGSGGGNGSDGGDGSGGGNGGGIDGGGGSGNGNGGVPREIEVPLSELGSPITAIVARNDNTHQTLTASNFSLNEELNEYEHLQPIEQARDSIVRLDGVEVTRDSNHIDDLIPNSTIELLAEQSDEVAIEITPDYEGVKSAVLNFVGSYNQLIRDVAIVARNDPAVLNEIDYFTAEERAQAQERLGVLQGENALSQLRTRLLTFAQNPYPTSAGRDINLLSQIGISTNIGGFNSGRVNPARLRGYLEFDEARFDTTLRENFEAVRELFGSDTDQDLIVDNGVAYQMDTYTNLYIQSGGIVQIRTNGLDGRIERNGDQLTTYNERIEDYERKLRNDFGRMQSALNSLDDTTRSLDNLQTQ